MTSILVVICRISQKNVKRHYLKKKELFLDFLLHFWNGNEMYNILKKKMSIVNSLFPKLLNPNDAVT